jgi:hypothetical protein
MLGAWLGPRSKPFDLIRIYAVSATIGFFFLYFGNIFVEPGAANYIKLLRTILSGQNLIGHPPNGVWGRDIGMSLIWLVSGYPITNSVIGLIVLQVFMGMIIPVLAYLTLYPWFPRAAYYTTLALTISLAPILLSKVIHHDQPYIFFTIVSLYLCNRYMLTKSPGYIYALGASLFGVGLIRLAGTGLFWLVMPICALQGGWRSLKHIALAAVIFIGATSAYTRYRTSLEGELAGVGIQLFYSVYINATEFGIEFSPEIGPAIKAVLDRVRECSLPSPAQSTYVRDWEGPLDFRKDNFDKYTTDQLIQKIRTQTDPAYYYYILGCVAPGQPALLDNLLFRASLETIWNHPAYAVKLFSRNIFQLLYEPGWLHDRFSTDSEIREGLHFPFGDNATLREGGTVGDQHLAQPALDEALFTPLARQSSFFDGPYFLTKELYYAIEGEWYYLYQPVTIILGCLLCFAWISTAIGLFQRAIGGVLLAHWSELWQSDLVIPASIGISVLLLGNIATTALAVDSLYRYDFSVLMLKFMLAGVGGAVAIELLRRTIGSFFPEILQSKIADHYAEGQ